MSGVLRTRKIDPDTATLEDLARYKGLHPRWHRWTEVVAVCRGVAVAIAEAED